MSKECITHHYACDCRERAFRDAEAKIERLNEWNKLSSDEMRLRCGELTNQEIRTVRAVLKEIIK